MQCITRTKCSNHCYLKVLKSNVRGGFGELQILNLLIKPIMPISMRNRAHNCEPGCFVFLKMSSEHEKIQIIQTQKLKSYYKRLRIRVVVCFSSFRFPSKIISVTSTLWQRCFLSRNTTERKKHAK